MALGKKTTDTNDNNTATKEAAAPAAAPASAPAAAPAAPESAAATATMAIAKASATSLSVQEAAAQAKAFEREVKEMKGASDFSYGNYIQFKGNNGEIKGEDGGQKVSLGRWAKVRLMSWDDSYQITPGEQSQASKNFVAYSKDGKVIDSVIGEEQKSWVGKPCQEYLDYLRDDKEGEGFGKAVMRPFIDTACALLGTDSGDGPVGTVIQVTLSKSSIPAFSRYQQSLNDTARAVSMGLPGFKLPEDPFTFFFLREAAAKGDNEWTKLKIVSELPAKI